VTQISSRMTFFYKRVFPVFWFGFLTLFIIGPGVIAWTSGNAPPPMFFAVPIFMMVFGYFLMKRFVFNLVDEVLDAGDALLVKNGGQQERIPLADITNISYAQMMNPPHVTLSLRQPTIVIVSAHRVATLARYCVECAVIDGLRLESVSSRSRRQPERDSLPECFARERRRSRCCLATGIQACSLSSSRRRQLRRLPRRTDGHRARGTSSVR